MSDTAGLVASANRSSYQYLMLAGVCAGAAYYTEDWIAAAAVIVIWLAWRYVKDDRGLPVISMALTFQWTQVTVGMWYHALTGRPVRTMQLADYRPMVLIGLGCVTALVFGLHAGMAWVRRSRHGTRPAHRLDARTRRR